jgi:hypothetical protein
VFADSTRLRKKHQKDGSNMKVKILIPTILALCAGGSLWSGSALADEGAPQKTEVSATHTWILSQVMNARVKDLEGDILGQIKDVTIDPATGRANFAVIQLNGEVGPRDAYAPVPWSLLKTGAAAGEPKTFILNADRNQFASSEKFFLKSWPDYSEATWGPSVYSYYGLDSRMPAASVSGTGWQTMPAASVGGTGWQTETAPTSYYYQDMRRYGPTRANGTPIDNGTAPDGKGTFVRGPRNF